ncbi:hypothetical protein QUN99_003368 [Vibrio parahaemolyticus]|nr:hypothetical protein [Vibrio parahaemolyticus]
MSSSSLNSYLLVSLLAVSGCNSDTAPITSESLQDVLHKAVVKGTYTEPKRNATLHITNEMATFSTIQGTMSKPFSVSDGKVIFDMNADHALRVVRPNLEMIIVNKGEILLCTACAGMGLDSHWYRTND